MIDTNRDGRPVFLVDAARTPFLKAKSGPGPFSASDLAVAAGRPLLARQRQLTAADFDEVILGCMMPGPEEANIARVAALRLGFGKKVPAWTVQRNCASGMQALDSGYVNIANGRAELVFAGGVEAMSHAPLLYNRAMVEWLAGFMSARKSLHKIAAALKFRPGMLKPVIALLKGLTDHTVGLNMGQTAEILADRFGVTREEMDTVSFESHRRLAAAIDEKRLTEVVPIYATDGSFYTDDDGVRRDPDQSKLASLKPFFDKPFGKVTPGNSSQITDGAVWTILASEVAVIKYGLKPLAKIIDTTWAGVDPAQMGLGPADAMAMLLHRNNLATTDIDYWEINEAFATQVLAVLAAFKDPEYIKNDVGLNTSFDPIPLDRLNVDGGAIAVGHPVGASGARIVVRLAHTLRANKGRYGVASLCIGGGQGGAMLIERIGGADHE